MTTFLTNILNKTSLEYPDKTSFHVDNIDAQHEISQQLLNYIKTLDPKLERPVVTVGIGTDRSTGDSLGPLVGTLLADKSTFCTNMHVYGTLDMPVHATNMADKIDFIMSQHENPIVIAIDASLGQSKNVGNINLGLGPLHPGAGVKKSLPLIGHMHLTATVNVGGYLEYLVLQNTRLSLVMRMAKSISEILYRTYRQINLESLKVPSH